MKRNINVWQFFGFGVTSLLGTLLHFLYEWSGNSPITAVFSAVNESTWEHMKLLFFPMFIFAIIQSRLFPERENFWCIKLRGILLGLALIPVLFYSYNGMIGKSPDFINISIFFISAAVSYIYETRLFNKEGFPCKHPRAAFITLCVIAASFVIFTFFTPKLAIFKDPITGTFGI